MIVKWSPHATGLFLGILDELADNLLQEAVYAWREKILSSTEQLADSPNIGTTIPLVCFNSPPENADKLHQIICKPYRIVYEISNGEIHILSIRHGRMLVAEGDTYWN